MFCFFSFCYLLFFVCVIIIIISSSSIFFYFFSGFLPTNRIDRPLIFEREMVGSF